MLRMLVTYVLKILKEQTAWNFQLEDQKYILYDKIEQKYCYPLYIIWAKHMVQLQP